MVSSSSAVKYGLRRIPILFRTSLAWAVTCGAWFSVVMSDLRTVEVPVGVAWQAVGVDGGRSANHLRVFQGTFQRVRITTRHGDEQSGKSQRRSASEGGPQQRRRRAEVAPGETGKVSADHLLAVVGHQPLGPARVLQAAAGRAIGQQQPGGCGGGTFRGMSGGTGVAVRTEATE